MAAVHYPEFLILFVSSYCDIKLTNCTAYARVHRNFTTPSPLLKRIQAGLDAFTFMKIIFAAPKA
jgi:hypothetical protein